MLSKLNCVALTVLLALATLAGCTRIIRKGPLIERYKAAECVPVYSFGKDSPPRRGWDYTLTTRGGVVAHLSGAQTPLGRVTVTYASDGKVKVAANPREYVYPVDIRFDATSGRLYTMASPPVLDDYQIWLYEYDLNKRRQIQQKRVDPHVLPQECQIK